MSGGRDQGAGLSTDDMIDWMTGRNQHAAGYDRRTALGRDAWAASTLTGDNLSAPQTGDIQTLAEWSHAPIKRGEKGILSDAEIAKIIFNETRSYSGSGVDDARIKVAHAIMNGDEAHGSGRPLTAAKAGPVPPVEATAYQAAIDAVATARKQRAQGVDPTDGAMHFRFPITDSRDPFDKNPLKTQSGPFHNSYQKGDVPSPTVYVDTYRE